MMGAAETWGRGSIMPGAGPPTPRAGPARPCTQPQPLQWVCRRRPGKAASDFVRRLSARWRASAGAGHARGTMGVPRALFQGCARAWKQVPHRWSLPRCSRWHAPSSCAPHAWSALQRMGDLSSRQRHTLCKCGDRPSLRVQPGAEERERH